MANREATTLTGEPLMGGVSLDPDMLRCLEELGLNGYQARVLVALLQCGSAAANELAQLAGVPRTSVYAVLADLQRLGVAHSLPGRSASWTSPGRNEVLDRLVADQEDRLNARRSALQRARETLAAALPDEPSAALPVVDVLTTASRVRSAYDRLLRDAKAEVMVFNRPPYSSSPSQVNPVVLEAAARGVRIRALYQAPQLEEPGSEAFRATHDAYHQAGVEPRVVDELPVKLAIADRAVALLTMADSAADVGSPFTVVHVENEGFAVALVATFEWYWAQARPYPSNDPYWSGITHSSRKVNT